MRTFTVDHAADKWTITDHSGSVIKSGPVNPRTIDHLIVLIKRAGLTVVTIGKKKKGKRVQTMNNQSQFNLMDARHYDTLLKISRDVDTQINRNIVRALIRRDFLGEDGVTITTNGRAFMQQYKHAHAGDDQEFRLSEDGSPILPHSNGNGHAPEPLPRPIFSSDNTTEIATLRAQVDDLTAQVEQLRAVVISLLRRQIGDADLLTALDLILQ